MLTAQEKEEALRRVDELNKEIRTLKAGLTELAGRRDEIFSRKGVVGKEIAGLIRSVRQLKAERNLLTDEVRTLKKERDALNKDIREKVAAIKAVHAERKEVEQKLQLKESPARLKAQIDRLDLRIETEGLTFEKEKQVMKQIRDLRKRYDEARKASGIWGKGHELSKEIDALREKADAVHAAIQVKSKESQERHERMLEACKRIDDLRVKEEAVLKELEPLKEQLQPQDQRLQELSGQVRALQGQLRDEERVEAETHAQEQKKKLSDRQAEVQEKLKKGGKLTTEDLLVLQSMPASADSN